jgi:HD-like signal output (HDOD) protein
MTPPDLSAPELSKLLDSIELPSCPVTLGQVMAEARKDSPDAQALTRLIAADVGLSAAAIKLANSPLYRRGEPLDSVPRAVALLGTRNVLNVAVSMSLRTSVGQGLPPEWLDAFWHRAGHEALAAGLVAKLLRGVPADTAYTYALFHHAAMPLMMKRFPDYRETLVASRRSGSDQAAHEHARHGCTHAQVGNLLARNWGMPAMLTAAIRAHHDDDLYHAERPDLPAQAASLIAVGRVAEFLVDELSGEDDAEGRRQGELASGWLGLGDDDLTDAREALDGAMHA